MSVTVRVIYARAIAGAADMGRVQLAFECRRSEQGNRLLLELFETRPAKRRPGMRTT